MVNQCNFVGYVGKDPKVFDTRSGTGCSFSICATTKWKDGEDNYWVNCSCFGKTSELIARLVKKGAMLFVTGRMNERKVEKNGETRYYHGLLVERFQVLKFADGGEEDENQDASFDYGDNSGNDEFEC